jgi:hypothetical protein
MVNLGSDVMSYGARPVGFASVARDDPEFIPWIPDPDPACISVGAPTSFCMNVSLLTSGGGEEIVMYRRNSPARRAARKNPNTTGVRFIVLDT